LKVKILSRRKKPKLILDHALGGGANAYSSLLVSQEPLAIVITPDGAMARNYTVRFRGQKLEEVSFPMGNIRDIERLLQHFGVEEVILNELIGYPKPKILELVDFLVALKGKNPQLDLSFLVHDFFSVCPIYSLLDYTIHYCGVPEDLRYCDKCLQLNPLMDNPYLSVKKDYPNLSMVLWREKFGALLACSSRIVCFSNSSKEILQKAYPSLPEDQFEITPHATDWVRPVVIHKSSKELNIAVLGHLEIQKGAHVVSLLASYIDYYGLNLRLHIFGEIFEPAESFDLLKPVVKHGRYRRTDLPSLMEENEIDLVLIPSICPETFSYTTEETIKMGLPVAVFDCGAPAERVRLYDKGIVLTKQDPDYIVEKICGYLNQKINLRHTIKKDIVFVCVSNNDLTYTRGVLSFAYMTEHKILKYDNRETNLPIPVRYNQAIRTLLESGYDGWIFFVHNDFSLLESVDDLVDGLDHNHLYGPIGAVLVNKQKQLIGQILQGHNGGLIHHGSRIDQPTLVDTVDCQCLLVHTDVLRKYNLRFDEHELLSFHQYVEEFCITASVQHAIQTYAVPLKCKHASWGTLNRAFDLAIDYIHAKYPYKNWAGTRTHMW
jgi:glycosyltransferase involved in cell wall biosynthesis